MTVKASDLKHRIVIQKPKDIKNNSGQIKEGEYEDFITVWASIKPLTGRMFFEAEKSNSEISHEIAIRYRKGISADIRIKFNDRYFYLISPPINTKELNFELLFMCKEVFS